MNSPSSANTVRQEAGIERYEYLPYRHLIPAGIVMICLTGIGAGTLLTQPAGQKTFLTGVGFMLAGCAAFLAAAVNWQWQWGQPRQTITLDHRRRVASFAWFRVYNRTGNSTSESMPRIIPRWEVPFDEIHDLYYHLRRSTKRVDRDVLALYFSEESQPRQVLRIVTTRGSLSIPLWGLQAGSQLVRSLHHIASKTPPAPLATNTEYQLLLWTGVGVVVAAGILAGFTWDMKELRWVWLLMSAGGVCQLYRAHTAAVRHQGSGQWKGTRKSRIAGE